MQRIRRYGIPQYRPPLWRILWHQRWTGTAGSELAHRLAYLRFGRCGSMRRCMQRAPCDVCHSQRGQQFGLLTQVCFGRTKDEVISGGLDQLVVRWDVR